MNNSMSVNILRLFFVESNFIAVQKGLKPKQKKSYRILLWTY